MPKLKTSQRKELPDEVFGLPKERKYPLHDETHVRSAIRYFDSCPKEKRKELASNINRMAKKYKMKIKISKDSAFKPYADSNILEESFDINNEPFKCIMEKVNLIKRHSNQYQLANNIIPDKFKESFYSDIKSQIQSVARDFLEKSHYLSDRNNTSRLSDFIFDTDIDLCIKAVNNLNTEEFPKIIPLIKNTSLLHNAFNEVKTFVNDPRVTSIIDEIHSIIDNNMNKIYDYSNILKNDEFFSKKPKFDLFNFQNFNEEEIEWFNTNYSDIQELCSIMLTNLVKKYNFPGLGLKYKFKDICNIIELRRRNLIDGYYLAMNKKYSNLVKKGNSIYVVIHVYSTEEKSNVTMLKIYDMDSKYFDEIRSNWFRSRKKIIPKMTIKQICFNKRTAFESFSLGGDV